MDNTIQLTINVTFLKFVGIILAILIFAYILYTWYHNLRHFFKRLKMSRMDRKGIIQKWDSIERLVQKGDEGSLKLAILDADKLVDSVLKQQNVPGDDMGARLKVICARNYRLQPVWKAHILRNKLAHDPTFHLYPKSAKNAIKTFKKALKELGAL